MYERVRETDEKVNERRVRIAIVRLRTLVGGGREAQNLQEGSWEHLVLDKWRMMDGCLWLRGSVICYLGSRSRINGKKILGLSSRAANIDLKRRSEGEEHIR